MEWNATSAPSHRSISPDGTADGTACQPRSIAPSENYPRGKARAYRKERSATGRAAAARQCRSVSQACSRPGLEDWNPTPAPFRLGAGSIRAEVGCAKRYGSVDAQWCSVPSGMRRNLHRCWLKKKRKLWLLQSTYPLWQDCAKRWRVGMARTETGTVRRLVVLQPMGN